MIINFYATLREIVGTRQVKLPVPLDGTLRELISEIIIKYPAMRAELLDPEGNLYGHIHVFVNGRDSTLLDGSLDTVLAPEDIISIFPPVGGG